MRVLADLLDKKEYRTDWLPSHFGNPKYVAIHESHFTPFIKGSLHEHLPEASQVPSIEPDRLQLHSVQIPLDWKNDRAH